ncbi:hypothetical protein ABTD32_19605, partial [Acinetobacter baumannii]
MDRTRGPASLDRRLWPLSRQTISGFLPLQFPQHLPLAIFQLMLNQLDDQFRGVENGFANSNWC